MVPSLRREDAQSSLWSPAPRDSGAVSIFSKARDAGLTPCRPYPCTSNIGTIINSSSGTCTRTPTPKLDTLRARGVPKAGDMLAALSPLYDPDHGSGPESRPARFAVQQRGQRELAAPETIKRMLARVPKEYDETYKYFTRRGSRVLALAGKEMDGTGNDKVLVSRLGLLTLLGVSGGRNGTAGYAQATGQTPSFGGMVYGESLCADFAFAPAIYNPNAAKGSRWSDAGLQASTIARLYHSSAILLPDTSVLIADSNPNVDVNTSTIFPTNYKAEIFYPPILRLDAPCPHRYFNVTIPASSYSGSANDAAANTAVWLRPARLAAVAAEPAPSPTRSRFIHVIVKGIPSNSTYAIVGSGDFGTQPTQGVQALPNPVRLDSASSSADSNQGSSGSGSTSSTSYTGAIIGGIVRPVYPSTNGPTRILDC
ncbi:hypothetical protein DFH11DRAFT_1745591 [Phellopilus nigrolimitatus]|nr:hypothetical protein DFH11DRAFT_1745591 [Phellopilus nigrolimitatus]